MKIAEATIKTAPSLTTNVAPPSSFDLLANVGMSFFFVIALILVLAWLVKRSGFRGMSHGLIRVRDSYAISAKERIILVEIDDQLLVVGVTSQQMTLLHTVDKENTKSLLSEASQTMIPVEKNAFKQILKASFKRKKE